MSEERPAEPMPGLVVLGDGLHDDAIGGDRLLESPCAEERIPGDEGERGIGTERGGGLDIASRRRLGLTGGGVGLGLGDQSVCLLFGVDFVHGGHDGPTGRLRATVWFDARNTPRGGSMSSNEWTVKAGRRLWHRHPGVRSGDQLTLGERAADRLRNGMGSWVFVLTALVFLAGWMAGNRGVGFDPYPFILLNLILSCVAALQGAVLLIAARRADQISAELATHDYETNAEALQLIRALHATITAQDGAAPDGQT